MQWLMDGQFDGFVLVTVGTIEGSTDDVRVLQSSVGWGGGIIISLNANPDPIQ
jgi:hypothetical protein